MIESFLNYIRYEKRLSDHTFISYQKDLQQYSVFISEQYQCQEIQLSDHNMLRSWVVFLVEKKLDPNSINRKLACLKSFFKFLVKKQVINLNPTLKLKPLKTAKRNPDFVEEEKLLHLLNDVPFEEDFEGCRSKLILEILYGTGIRLSELIHLKWGDIDFYQKQIKVKGKRNKERIIPLNEPLLKLIKIYELTKRSHFLGELNQPYLIVTVKGEKSYPMLIYKTVKKYLNIITTKDKRSPHTLRHSFATHLLNKGANLNAIKDLLGHSSLSATQVYTHNSLEQLKKVYSQAHPKAE